MCKKLIFLNHAGTKIDKNIPAQQWGLSKDGILQSNKLVDDKVFLDIDIIYCSIESKCYQTIKPLADKLGINVIQFLGFEELHKGLNEYMSSNEYGLVKSKMFKDLNEALNRFKNAVNMVSMKYSDQNVLIVSHGSILAVYFSYLDGKLKERIPNLWGKVKYCDYAIIEKGKVVRNFVGF
jgi:broad specificity phosphatase PhoE